MSAGDAPSDAPLPADGPRLSRRFTRDPATLTAFVLVMLAVGAVIDLVGIGLSVAALDLLDGAFGDDQWEEAWAAHGDREFACGLVELGIRLVTVVGFLKWVYRAHLNVRGFGAADMPYSPGWAVGWFFVPFLNLWRPVQMMGQLWRASRNPADWQAQPGTPLLAVWWGLWLAAGLMGRVAFQLSLKAQSVAEFRELEQVSIAAAAVDAALCLAAAALVAGVYRMQAAWVRGPDDAYETDAPVAADG